MGQVCFSVVSLTGHGLHRLQFCRTITRLDLSWVWTLLTFVYGAHKQIILIINSDEILESFKTHKLALTADTHISSGPIGAAFTGSIDIKRKPAPVYSYVNSRGFYAGIELSGQVFLDRFDENERFYYWPGIKARDILEGRVRAPPSVQPLHQALLEAETGVAQGGVLEMIKQTELPQGPDTSTLLGEGMNVLQEGERLQLPPTPEQLEAMEHAGFKDELDEEYERKQREEIRNLPPPPKHPNLNQARKSSGRPPHETELSDSNLEISSKPDQDESIDLNSNPK